MNTADQNKYLLAIALGPVQGFIASARKTRDLWAGSHLLSELAKAAATALKESGAELIFPGLVNGAIPETAANVVLAEAANADVETVQNLAASAKQAVYARWEQFCEMAVKKAGNCWDDKFFRLDLWSEQKRPDEVIEFYSAAVPLTGDYVQARRRVTRLLAGRKNVRDFTQPGKFGIKQGVPKSSLDGANESIISENLAAGSGYWKEARERLLLKKGEQLDAVGLVKRLGVKNTQKAYPSLLEIAVEPMLEAFGINLDEREEVDVDELSDFDFFGENGRKLVRSLNEEGLYLAVLHADGDRMGAAISQQKSADAHRKFSAALSAFSGGVSEIVKKYLGVCVYAGGDDVLAFLPIDRCLDCASALREHFIRSMADYPQTSLSVGLAIGHYHEMLEDLLDFGRMAEKTAKTTSPGHSDGDPVFGNRNGLAVELSTRGNIAVSVREQWSEPDKERGLVKRIERWSQFFAEGKIPGGYPYEVQDIIQSDIYDKSKWKDDSLYQKALKADILRLTRKKPDIDSFTRKNEIEPMLDRCDSSDKLQRFFNEMYIARTIGCYRQMIQNAGANRKERRD